MVTENGGKHPFGLTLLLYPLRDKGGKGCTGSRESIKKQSFQQQSSFFQNRDPVMKMVCDFEKRAESVAHPVTD